MPIANVKVKKALIYCYNQNTSRILYRTPIMFQGLAV